MSSLKSRLILSELLVLLLCLSAPVQGALNAVSSDAGGTQLNLANGFPLWYQDSNGTRLELCLEQVVTSQSDGITTFRPCLTAEPNISRPISFPTNFGAEAFYWLATGSGTFSDSNGNPGNLLLVMGLEGGFTTGLIFDGTQTVFSRVRVRVDLPVTGTYRVTHPLGNYTYDVTVAGTGVRGINQTQDIGDFLIPVDFTAALVDGPLPVPSPLFDPAISEGIVSSTGTNITNFLGAAGANPLVDSQGNMYLAEAGPELTPTLSPIAPGVDNVDYFSIELLHFPDGSTPDPVTGAINGYYLNGADSSQTVTITGFQISGKIFNQGNNTPPVALPDTAATSPGTAVLIDVQGNDSDLSDRDPANPTSGSALNVHGLNPQALGLMDGPDILLTGALTTAAGATVRRVIDVPTGKALFLYTPPAGFSGEDGFDYVIQDTGGLLSAATPVSVTVEDLQVTRAEFRPQTGKWRVAGTTSDPAANAMTVTTGPKAFLDGSAVIPTPVATEAQGTAALRVGAASIAYHLEILTAPTSEIDRINIHLGDAAAEGPVLFSLFDSRFDPPLDGPLTGTLTGASLNVQTAAGITTFADAARALLDGKSYISILTVDHPQGEIRGQLRSALLGSASAEADGSWSFQGRARTLPSGALPSVNARSANGIEASGIPLQLR